MSWHRIKRNKNDIDFSNFIRERAKWRCEYCHKLCKVNGTTLFQLEASHYWGRGKWSTRYDIENVFALCSSCHKRMGGYTRSETGEYDLWVKQKLGDVGYNKLKIRANTYCGHDDKLTALYIQKLTEELKNV